MARVSDQPQRWSQAIVYPDMWLDPDEDPRDSGCAAGACKHAGMTATVAKRFPALLEELDRYPDDRAEIVRAAWAWA
jgi:hypothetical protein